MAGRRGRAEGVELAVVGWSGTNPSARFPVAARVLAAWRGAPTAEVGSVQSIVLDVRVVPRARRTTVDGERNGAILIRLAAPPVDGAANEALVQFLSGVLDLPRRQITIVSGKQSRDKRVRITGQDAESIRSRLLR